ncbi:MAG: hypothetical protein CFE21_01610 [Bacteroidetes bacterium B1(2017)]|nr:MAG: hypothetical protein CFE21_01610 [Bacteroidetes bacterium B1(2017)]
MRKIGIYILVLTFLLPALNQSLKIHFCGNELTGFSWNAGVLESDNCECADVGSTDCCTDLIVKSDLKDLQVQPRLLELPKAVSFSLIILPYTFFRFEPIDANAQNAYASKAPPPKLAIELSSLQVFRI